jgi:hypothetical protein
MGWTVPPEGMEVARRARKKAGKTPEVSLNVYENTACYQKIG